MHIVEVAMPFSRCILLSLVLFTLSGQVASANPNQLYVADHTVYAESYHALIEKYDYYFELERDSALTLLTNLIAESDDQTVLAESYYLIGSLYSFSPQSDSAILYLNKASELSEKINYKQVWFRALNHLGMVYAIAQNNKEALDYFTQAYQGAEQMADTTMVSMVSNNLAILYTRFELYETAIDWHNKSRNILELKGLHNVEDSARMRSHLTNIGVLYESLNMDQKAINTWSEALGYTPGGSIQLYTNLSTGYKKIGQYDVALDYAEKAIEFVNNGSDITYSAHINAIRSKMEALQKLERKKEALSIARNALTLSKEHQLTDQLIGIYIFTGDIFLDFNQKDSALTYLNLAHELLKETESLYLQAETFQKLSELFEIKEQSSRALDYLKSYVIVNDSIVHQEKEKQAEKAKILINYRDIESENQQLILKNQIQNLKIDQDKNLRIALITSLVLVLIIIIYVIRVYFIKKNQARKLQLLVHQKTKSLQGEVYQKELLNKQLLKEKEKAQESDRLKSAFLLNMSHEIHTPMSDILGFANLLLEPDLTKEDKKEFADIINKSGQRLLGTIHDLVDISRIDANEVQVTIENVSITDMIVKLKNDFQPQCAEKGLVITVESDILSPPIILPTDKLKLSSIFKNLLKNAVKYTHDGTIIVGLNKNDNFLEFYISDTGIGIAKDRQVAIFERFIQADLEDKNALEGSGLGLAIVKSYIGMLGGKVWVKSELGKGATFFFTLPIKEFDHFQ